MNKKSEPAEKDLGESHQLLDLSKTSKARSRNVFLTRLCLIKGRCGFETGEILSKESANHDGATEIAMTRSFQIVADFCGRFFNGQSFVSSRTVHQQRCTMSQRIQLALSIVRGQVIGAGFYGIVNGPCLS